MAPTDGEDREDGGSGPGRFEFRVWDPDDDVLGALEAIGRPTGTDTSVDRYLVGPDREVNLKVRDDRLELKRLIETRDGLQRWRPSWSADLPIDHGDTARLLDELGLDAGPTGGSDPHGTPLDVEELSALVALQPGGHVGTVRKQRQRFELNGLDAEASEVTVEGVAMSCVVVEGTDPSEVARAARSIGLDGPNRAVHEVVADVMTKMPTTDRGSGT